MKPSLRPLLAPALLGCLALACPAPGHSQARTSARTAPEISKAVLRAHLYTLADDSMQGRDAGRAGNVRATDYIARHLRRMGVEPAGENGTYFQTVPLVRRSLDPASTLRVDAAPLAYDTDFLPLRPIGLTVFGGRFQRDGVPVVYGGRLGADAITPEQARGRFVVFLPPAGPQSAQGTQMLPIGPLSEVLAPYGGAAGVAVVGLELATPPQLRYFHAPVITLADPAAPRPTMPGVLVTSAAAERMLGAPLAGLRPGAAGRTVSGAFGFHDAPTEAPARNVVGIIRGRDPALRGEYVAVGAHSDHVGISPVPLDHDSLRLYNGVLRPSGLNEAPRQPTPEEATRLRAALDSLHRAHGVRRDSIFNGADDDASGTSVALAVAEYFAKHPTRRSLLFVWHTAEEKGLFGASYYTDHPTVPRDSIVTQVNMDQVSRGGPADVAGSRPNTLYLLGSRRLSTELGDRVERANAAVAHPFALDYSLDAPNHPAMGYCRSDHYMYARYGIPIVFLSAGWHRDYHMVTDEPQYASLDTMQHVGDLVRDLLRDVGDMDHRPKVDGVRPDPGGTCRQ